MRYVIDEWYDDSHQECTGIDCMWRGGPHDEPFRLCPLCFSRLEVAPPDA
jgi:hypothetical protein